MQVRRHGRYAEVGVGVAEAVGICLVGEAAGQLHQRGEGYDIAVVAETERGSTVAGGDIAVGSLDDVAQEIFGIGHMQAFGRA